MEETVMNIAQYVLQRMPTLDQRNEQALQQIAEQQDARALLVGDDLASRHLARLWAMGPGSESPDERRKREQKERFERALEETQQRALSH